MLTVRSNSFLKRDASTLIKVALVVGKMNAGGKKTLSMNYFRHFDPRVIKVDFICDLDSQDVPEDEIASLGGKVSYIAPYQHIIANMRDFYKLCKQEQYDVVHAYNSTMNVFPMFAAKCADVPMRVSESLSMANEKEAKTLIKKILRPLSRFFATHFMSCGEDCGRWQFGDKRFECGQVAVFITAIEASRNAYDPDLRRKVRQKLNIEDKFVAGFIGRLAPQKNPEFIIEVFSELLRKRPEAVLLLVGDGPLRDEVLQKIDELGVGPSVIYLGQTEDIVGLYMAMDCFLLPSLYEGLPVVGLEAQCAGLPVFFSSEVTREVGFCSLAHFINIDLCASEWAELICAAVQRDSGRRSYFQECLNAGFDVSSETLRLEKYYLEGLQLP